mgnify:FL=1
MSKLTAAIIDPNEQEKVGHALRNVRKLLQIKLEDISDLAFISYGTILYYERSGTRTKKNINYLWMIYTDYFIDKYDRKEICNDTSNAVANELRFIETCLYGDSTAFDWYEGNLTGLEPGCDIFG